MARGTRLESLYYDIEARTEGLSTGLQAAERRLQRFAGVIKAHPVAAMGALAATAALVGIEFTKMAVQFDTSMRRVTSGLRDGAQQLDAFKKGVLELSTRLPKTADELASAAAAIVEIGGQEMQESVNVLRRLDLTAQASVASGADLVGVVRDLDDVMDGFGLSGNEAADAVVRMTFGVAQGRVPFGTFLSTLAQLGPAARAAGVSLTSTASVLATLMDAGVPTRDLVMGLKMELGGITSEARDGFTRLDQYGIVLQRTGDQLSVSGQLAGEFSTAMADARGNTEAMGQALEAARQGPGARMLEFMNRLKARALEVGDALLGPLAWFLEQDRRMEERWQRLFSSDVLGNARNNAFRRAQPPIPSTPGTSGPSPLETGGGPTSPPADPAAAREAARRWEEGLEAWLRAVRETFTRNWGQVFEAIQGRLGGVTAEVARLAELGREGTAEWEAQVTALAQLREHAMAVAQAAGDNQEEFQRWNDVVKDIDRQMASMDRATGARTRELVKQTKELKEQNRDLATQARNIEAAARGGIQLANAFGLVGDEAAQILENIAQVAANIPALMKALEKGGAAGIATAALPIAGGLAALAQTLLGGGPDPEEERRREVLRHNTEALLVLSQTIGESQLAISGSTAAGATQFLRQATPVGLTALGLRGPQALATQLSQFGVSMQEWNQLLQELGITLSGTVPTLAEAQQILQAIQQLELDRVFAGWQAQFNLFQRTLDMFDVSDPIEALTRLQQVILGLEPGALGGISAFDLSTAEGRAAADAFLQDLFRRATTGGAGDFAAFFGGLTPQEFLEALAALENAIDAANEAGGTGSTQTFGINRSITEVRGARIEAQLTTVAYHGARTADAVEAILDRMIHRQVSVLPPTWDELNAYTGNGGGRGGVVINGGLTVQVTVQAGASAQQTGERIAEATVRAIDQALGERLRQRERTLGIVTVH